MNIYQRLLAVQKAVDTVKKNGRNDFHKYSYATEADVLSAKDVMNENGLVVLPTMVSQQTGFKPDGKSWASVTMVFRVIDAETGECIESQFTGYAEDKNDKAIYKATTGASKYFYLKFCGMATDDDPENEKQAPKKEEKYSAPPAAKQAEKKEEKQSGVKQGEVALFAKNRALKAANSILLLQKQAKISSSDVLLCGGIDSIKGLAAAGNYTALEAAYQRLNQRYPAAM